MNTALFDKSVAILNTSGALPWVRSVRTVVTLSDTLAQDLRKKGVRTKVASVSIPYFASPVLNRAVAMSDYAVAQALYYASDRIGRDVDLVHFNFAGFLPKWLHRKMARKVYVSTIYDIVDIVLPEKAVKKFEVFVKRATEADRIIVSSRQTKSDIVEHLKVSEEKIDIIHVGVDNTTFIPPKVKSFSDEKVVIHVGGPVKRKNKEYALRVFAEVLKTLPKTTFMMVGYSDKETGLADELGIRSKVKFVRNLSEVELVQAYQQSDLMIYPTTYDGYSVPVVEAMCCGVPSITHNNTCFPEIINNAGIIMPDYNLGDWSDKCIKTLTDRDYWSEISRKCLDRSKDFTREKYVNEIIKSYATAAERKRARQG
jgi:glycosyltransferase involved in cell wall biosynthesis